MAEALPVLHMNSRILLVETSCLISHSSWTILADNRRWMPALCRSIPHISDIMIVILLRTLVALDVLVFFVIYSCVVIYLDRLELLHIQAGHWLLVK